MGGALPSNGHCSSPLGRKKKRNNKKKRQLPGSHQRSTYLLRIPRLTIPKLVVSVFFIFSVSFERKVILIVKGPHVDVVAPPPSILFIRLDHAFALVALSHLDNMPPRSTICQGAGQIRDRRRRGAGFMHEPSRVCGEPLVDLLEAFPRRFDDEEVDDGDEGGV